MCVCVHLSGPWVWIFPSQKNLPQHPGGILSVTTLSWWEFSSTVRQEVGQAIGQTVGQTIGQAV